MSSKEYLGALDNVQTRKVILSELQAATDAATVAAAINALADHNQFTDADKALVAALSRYKGEHADLAALETAHPAAGVTESDAWAQLEGTDVFAVIDNDTGTWVEASAPPSSVDTALNAASSSPVTNMAITNALAGKLQSETAPIPGNGSLVSFNIATTITDISDMSVRRVTSKAKVELEVQKGAGNSVDVGPYATAPAAGVFELVVTGYK